MRGSFASMELVMSNITAALAVVLRERHTLVETPCGSHAVFYIGNTVTVAKIAISVPRETVARVDRAARKIKVTRSRFISLVLDAVARNRRDREISARVDAALDEIEQESTEALLRARHQPGTEW